MLTVAVTGGLAVYFSIAVLRALPILREWTARGVKPWSCNLCMSFWMSAAMGAAAYLGSPKVLWVPAAAGAALMLSELHGLVSARRIPTGIPDLPPPPGDL